MRCRGQISIRESDIDLIEPAADAWLKREERTWVWQGVYDHEPVVFKLYRRREPWHTLRCALTRYRVEREFQVLKYLREREVPCCGVIGWARGRDRAHGYFELLIVRRIIESTDLETVIRSGRAIDLKGLFAIVRRMHDAGVCSQALVCRNVLVSSAGSRTHFALIDFPRARVFSGGRAMTRMAVFDLALLIQDLERLGAPLRSETLAAYGLSGPSADILLAQCRRRRTGKYARRLADAESRLRSITLQRRSKRLRQQGLRSP
jgi:tRNA A-37 threonylcarbamoyl transferase component Bud32